jgi:hypothetical protein
MTDLIRNITEQSGAARADRYYAAGTVASVDRISNLALVDVGAPLPDGTPTYRRVAYSPQQPPQVGDSVTILHTNVSPHSGVIASMQQGNSQIGVANNAQVVANGGVTGINGLMNAVTLAAGANVTLGVAGQTITIGAGGVSGITAESGGGAAVGPESVLNFASANANANWTVADDTGVTPHRIDVTLTVPTQSAGSVGAMSSTLTELTDPVAAVTLAAGTTIVLSNAHGVAFKLPAAAANPGVVIVICTRTGSAVAVSAANSTDTIEGGTGRNNVWYQSNGAGIWRNILSSNNP